MTQVTAPSSSSHPTQESTPPQPEDDDEARDREEATRSAWRVLVCCSSSRRGKPNVANNTSSSSVAPIATAASAGFLSTLTNWSLGLKTSKLAKRFHPGPGYERVPLAHSDSDASFADEPETGSISTGPVGRTASRRQGSTRTLAASGSRGSFGSLPEGASLAALAQRLEGLSAVSAVKASLVTTGDVVRLTISGPMRLEYSLDADGYVMEAVRAVNRLPASLFDVNGCPITPVAAMDAMEEVIAKALRSTRGVGIVTSVTLEHIALSSAAAPSSSSTLLQRQISTDGDDDGEVVSRRDVALMRARHSKTAALSDHLAAAADAFHSDYTPGEVRQRVRHFVHNVLDAVSSSTLQELVLDHCTFGDAFMLADLLTSPCIPRASRRDRSHPWNGGLHTLELKSCGLTAAHISTLLRELNAVQRGLHPFLEGNLFTVLQHLTLLGMGSASGALPNLLGFIADTAELDGGSQHTGLQDLVIDEELVSVVLKHRLAPFLATINGRRVEDELASR